jgi:hypothetical protein
MRLWLPIGPSGVLKGQASGNPLVSGRVTGIAPLSDGNTVYVCTANGGVWKTTDAGRTWAAKMAGFQPGSTPSGVDSQACGAIAVAPAAGAAGQDRVYLGTGEGFVAGDRYFGVGPVVSEDGGTTWVTEQATPTLVGSGFWRIVIDPGNAQHAFAATREGLYERVPSGSHFVWNRVSLPTAGITQPSPQWDHFCTGLAVAQLGGVTHVYAALAAVPTVSISAVFHWDSSTAVWSVAGAGWNPTNPSVTVLAMQPTNPVVVYALVANLDGHMAGVFRLDTSGGASAQWVALSHFPADLFGSLTIPSGHTRPDPGQGRYDIAIAVDPVDVNRIYLGGSFRDHSDAISAALFRCQVTLGSSNQLSTEDIGARVHADVHAIEFQPGGQRTLWVGCDGGVFVTNNALGDEKDSGGHVIPTTFASRNLGLSTLQFVKLGMHPTEDGVLFGGLQDNGTLRYTGEELWLEVDSGDGGAVLVNSANPRRLTHGYVGKSTWVASDGGQSGGSWSEVVVQLKDGEQVRGYPPIVGLPPTLVTTGTADLLAFGSERVWISTDFGRSWPSSIPSGARVTDAIDGMPTKPEDNHRITALAWASATKLYAGTSTGTVARFDRASATSSTWTRRIVNTPPSSTTPPSGAAIATTVPPNPITSIAVDADPVSGGNTIYITIGGQLSSPYLGRARVWRGSDTGGSGVYTWETRSGPGNLADPAAATPEFRLLDIHHSVIIVDPAHPERLYVGADIGVWRSHDSGHNWYPYSLGIPEVAVTDLKLHPNPTYPTERILWAATHGRGVYEISAEADPRDPSDTFLRYLVRDSHLDVGRRASVAGAIDPTSGAGAHVAFGHSPDIRIDAPARDGTYSTIAEDISAVQFYEAIDGGQTRAFRPQTGSPVDNRVFVLVHQRGTALPLGAGVQVMLLLAPGTTPPALPAGYTTNVQNGAAVTGGAWTTVGTTTVTNVWPLTPRIAHFRLSSSSLAGHNDWCLLVLLHAAGVPGNAFTATDTDVQAMCAQSQLAAWSTFSVVETTRATSKRDPGFLAMILETIGLGSLVSPGNDGLPADVIDY